ncbi:MAG: hypothetical protein LBC75_02640 [Fibromonadaceae bacterium]|nr:hypothetical protein [Fibromonadaceae bacterium]
MRKILPTEEEFVEKIAGKLPMISPRVKWIFLLSLAVFVVSFQIYYSMTRGVGTASEWLQPGLRLLFQDIVRYIF